ncbi:hypothetical protein [Novilysobacter avium]|uniref:C-type lysozyme inhibitor domain-containing protein n=1 Tax=Novilysobacter avium TaxID=2781023 RepID=A0A7S6UKK8_9GAMM|nr:hypothetical protein [Lysobacter avium]QOW22028.1 hypothetical protein INQ42_12640 [Lysobacter avium]
MKRILLLFLAALACPAQAMELYCQGTAWTNTGQSIDDSRLLTLDKDKGEITVSTFTGMATGKIKVDPQLYTGFLHSQTVTYWFNLDRYSGSFVLVTTQQDGRPGRGEFSGTCKQRSQQF